jgi:hypothetical protein
MSSVTTEPRRPAMVYIANYNNEMFRIGATRDVATARTELAAARGFSEIVYLLLNQLSG